MVVLGFSAHGGGQKTRICTRGFSDGGKNPRFAPVKFNMKGDGGKKAGFAPVVWGVPWALPAFNALRLSCVTPTGGQRRRNSLRFAPFGPPTVSCVLAAARTCIRQAPPTSRGRGPATSAVLPVRSATSATREKAMKKGWSRFSATLCLYQLIRCYSFTQRTGQELAFLASAFN